MDGRDDLQGLLRLEMDTLWRVDEGCLAGTRYSDPGVVPLLAVAVSADADRPACVWACRTNLPPGVTSRVEALLADEAAAGEVGWQPERAPALLDLLVPFGPLEPPSTGPSFVAALILPPPAGVECWTGLEAGDERLIGRMPEHDRQALVGPWAVVLAGDGQVAAVCETARSATTPGSVEAGLWTYEAYRHRGFGAAATAAWMGLVADRTVFYSTSADNVASQAVARRLGLRPLGQWWSVQPTEPAGKSVAPERAADEDGPPSTGDGHAIGEVERT